MSETHATAFLRRGKPKLRKTGCRRSLKLGNATAGAASSAPTGYCYGKTFRRRKREQAPALHSIAARLHLECGGLPPLSRAACCATTGCCYGKTFWRRKRQQAPALHSIDISRASRTGHSLVERGGNRGRPLPLRFARGGDRNARQSESSIDTSRARRARDACRSGGANLRWC
jgi:hypothetical protein